MDDLKDLYSELDFRPFDVPILFPTDRLILAALSRSTSPLSKVLDFGCSTGRILARLPQSVRKFGIEINASAAAIARGRGVQIISEDELGGKVPNDFDAVICTDVYEHLVEPARLAEKLARAIKPGGLLVLVTGNADSVTTRAHIAEFWYFRIAGHFQMLGARHLNWLGNRLGLTLDAAHQTSHYDTSLRERLRERIQSFAYFQFRCRRRSVLTSLLRRLPVISRADQWPNAPFLGYTSDHYVAVFRKPAHPPISL